MNIDICPVDTEVHRLKLMAINLSCFVCLLACKSLLMGKQCFSNSPERAKSCNSHVPPFASVPLPCAFNCSRTAVPQRQVIFVRCITMHRTFLTLPSSPAQDHRRQKEMPHEQRLGWKGQLSTLCLGLRKLRRMAPQSRERC